MQFDLGSVFVRVGHRVNMEWSHCQSVLFT